MTPEEAANQYRELKRAYARSITRAEIGALSGQRGQMIRRIHNEGNAHGGKIGKYRSASYRRKRRRKGLQTGTVDLTFYRDLSRSYRVGRVAGSGENAIGFINDRERRKGSYQETRYKKAIFSPTMGEAQKMTRAYARILNREVKQVLDDL